MAYIQVTVGIKSTNRRPPFSPPNFATASIRLVGLSEKAFQELYVPIWSWAPVGIIMQIARCHQGVMGLNQNVGETRVSFFSAQQGIVSRHKQSICKSEQIRFAIVPWS